MEARASLIVWITDVKLRDAVFCRDDIGSDAPSDYGS
jgi:hypothetical protein